MNLHETSPQRFDDFGLPILHDLDASPAAGVRFRECDAEYGSISNNRLTHAIYLPSDWTATGRYPVLVEYAGNRFRGPGLNGDSLALDGLHSGARMGYFLAGKSGSPTSGLGCIWVTMPFIAYDHQDPDRLTLHQEADTWFGNNTCDDPNGQRLTAAYLKRNLPAICSRFGGDPKRVIFCGFSRGAIAGGYIGRADDDVAKLFCGYILHSHHDASGEPLAPDDRDGLRCARAVGRPSFLSAGGCDSGKASSEGGTAALRAAKAEATLHIIPDIPHTDEWLFDRHYHRPICAKARDAARQFLWKLAS